MKITAVTIMIVLFLATLSPLTAVQVPSGAGTVSIRTLDVCHQTGSMVLNNLDMPFVFECSCTQAPVRTAAFLECQDPATVLPLITIPIDLPPKV